jgi:hypothetical protein
METKNFLDTVRTGRLDFSHVLEGLVKATDNLAKALELIALMQDREFERRWLAARPDCAQLSLA